MFSFFCWRCFHFFSVWFCIVSLSPVSRQWFYPMVGDIMLFYHRVEPRTGCWEVSASVNPSVRQFIHPPNHPINPARVGRGLWSAGCCSWWRVPILSNMPLSTVLFLIQPCCIYPHCYMFCPHVIHVSYPGLKVCSLCSRVAL